MFRGVAEPGFKSLLDGLLDGVLDGLLEGLLEHSKTSCGVGGLHPDKSSVRIRI